MQGATQLYGDVKSGNSLDITLGTINVVAGLYGLRNPVVGFRQTTSESVLNFQKQLESKGIIGFIEHGAEQMASRGLRNKQC